jgi:hypothetical protein
VVCACLGVVGGCPSLGLAVGAALNVLQLWCVCVACVCVYVCVRVYVCVCDCVCVCVYLSDVCSFICVYALVSSFAMFCVLKMCATVQDER